MTAIQAYTLVQHSGYGYAGKPAFKQAVEPRSITTVGERNLVRRAGGIVFNSYKEADDASERVNGEVGDRPFLQADGTFSSFTIDSLAVYIPNNVMTV